MEKLYSQELLNEQFTPKKETLSFLLNYSKSIKVIKNKKDQSIMFHLN